MSRLVLISTVIASTTAGVVFIELIDTAAVIQWLDSGG